LICFSHHIPGCESKDLAFFTEAAACGFRVEEAAASLQPQMWSDNTVNMFIYKLELLSLPDEKTESVQMVENEN
jgi:hypothetical protein